MEYVFVDLCKKLNKFDSCGVFDLFAYLLTLAPCIHLVWKLVYFRASVVGEVLNCRGGCSFVVIRDVFGNYGQMRQIRLQLWLWWSPKACLLGNQAWWRRGFCVHASVVQYTSCCTSLYSLNTQVFCFCEVIRLV